MGSRAIYVIDDDEAVRDSLCMLIRMHGWPVVSFPSAADFLSRVDVRCGGALITDLDLPGITGPQLQQHLIAEDSPLAVVVISGVADMAATASVMKSGAVAVLEKPFSESQLISAIERGWQQSLVKSHALSSSSRARGHFS